MTHTRWVLAIGVTLLAAAVLTVLLLVADREPQQPDPFALTPEGTYRMPASLTTHGVNPCDLLTADEVGQAYDEPPVFTYRNPDDPEFCNYTAGGLGIVVYVGYPTDRITDPITEAGVSVYVTVGGHPSRVYAPADQVIRVVAVTVDAVPGRPGLFIQGGKDDNCAVPLRLAELALSRLPAAP